ncbi:hypothetical protein KAR91_53935 [Candidatus Pacearchaeota archaeon]|nr:hypothetical protein [Candidatus Pacearchaeota archaeon]
MTLKSTALWESDTNGGVDRSVLDLTDGVLYIKGNESTDGSIRMRVDTGVIQLEARATGSWALTTAINTA